MPDNRHGGEVDAPNPLPAERHLPCNVLSMNVPDASEQCRETEHEDAALGVTVRSQGALSLSKPSRVCAGMAALLCVWGKRKQMLGFTSLFHKRKLNSRAD